ncbi:protein phosphatase 1, regulatory (inhibitor) subunit 14Aa isoform X2 [Astyanax mexicanus]|uniref:Protein phosphatase 1 regulatory subunit 14A-like n=2 Tax=Astyanax mexicanus TaxID=7994 RepID=A0A8B9RLX3_ASTMX|nr:protein phosphatase 1, regulatory (inhibitor) subunit 14Aa isoform X2 [Astyanax mexicanus]
MSSHSRTRTRNMAEEQNGGRREEDGERLFPRAALSAQKRQSRVTVKYNRKELQKRLDVETWIEEALEELYAGLEDEMPDEIDIDELLVLQSDEERVQKIQELLQTCTNSTQAFITELLQKLHGLQKQEELQNKGIGHPCLHSYPHHHGNVHHHGNAPHHQQQQQRAHQTL